MALSRCCSFLTGVLIVIAAGAEEPAAVSQPTGCHTAVAGEECYTAVEWAMTVGVKEHPEWYAGYKTPEDFQYKIHSKGLDGCPMPCPAVGSAQAAVQPPVRCVSSSKKLRGASDTVSILHISDTHSHHEQVGVLPPADILIHSGDVSATGLESEFSDFNDWLGKIKGNYKHVFVIAGNHDWWETKKHNARAALDPAFFQKRITNAKVLNHETAEVMGLKIWGAGWNPMAGDAISGNRYDDVASCIDVLVTHEAPYGIFDAGGHWGGNNDLLAAIYNKKPKVHLFGHIHEQRGHWDKVGGQFVGGSEYHPRDDVLFNPQGPPPANYPVEVESNNAMANQPILDHTYTGVWQPQHIVGKARMITAKDVDGVWHFTSSVVP